MYCAPLLLFIAAGANLAGATLADDGLGAHVQKAFAWFIDHPWWGALAVGGFVGLMVAGMDLAPGSDVRGTAIRGVLWGALGAMLQRFSIAVVIGRRDQNEQRHQ
jgi:hypothetical protein